MTKNGFTLIEIIIAIALAALFLPAIAWTLGFSLNASSQGEKYSQAQALSQEAMEAVFYLKGQEGNSWDWETTPLNTSPTEFYQPTLSGGVWVLGGKTMTPAEVDGFTTRVAIEAVRRCGTSICDEGFGQVDSFARKVTTWVLWVDKGQDQEIVAEAYVTKH